MCNYAFYENYDIIKQIKLTLASSSPRRTELLKRLGVNFDILPSEVNEDAQGLPEDIVKELAIRKAIATSQLVTRGWVLAADTIVVLNGKVLGKPINQQHAFEMLKMLSGNRHDVYTGVSLINCNTKVQLTHVEKTSVTFHKLADIQIQMYIASGDPMDKAGSYGIQGDASSFIAGFDGDYTNVMGLPLYIVTKLLAKVACIEASERGVLFANQDV